jgi:hypothetical protein
MLPNFSRLGLARTGMVADGDVDDDADAPSDPAPGEVATLHDQYMETSDFFVAVLQQIDDGSGSLKRVCEAVKSWCATDKGRWTTCNDEHNNQEWVKLTEKVFTKYGLPQDGEENPPPPYINFVSLCNVDPVKRLVRIGRRCYWANQQRLVLEDQRRLVLEAEDEDEDGDGDEDEREDKLKFRALMGLFTTSNHGYSQEPEPSDDEGPGPDAWTTERDDQADVALALTVLAEEFSQDATGFVQEQIRGGIIRQLQRLENVNLISRPRVVRMRAQLARLTSWLFTRTSLSDLMDPLDPYGDALCEEFYCLLDQVRDATDHDHDLFDDGDDLEGNETRLAELAWTALRDVAKYNEGRSDWSSFVILSDETSNCEYLKSTLWFLRRGTQPVRHLVLEVIHDALRIPSVNPHMPEMPRKVRFLRSLVDANGITLIGDATIGDPKGRSWSIIALETVAKQLAQLDKQQQDQLRRSQRGR